MALEEYLEEVQSCVECYACKDVCPAYLTTKNDFYTPTSKLEVAKTILNNQQIQKWMVETAFFCTQCKACEKTCPVNIRVSDIVGASRTRLFKMGFAPLESHKKIIDSILKNQNSVGGNPEKRWDWLPESYKQKFNSKSSTMFFVGCLSAYLTKEAAVSTIKVLDKAGFDFRLVKDEGCCGAPFINFGDMENAEKLVKEKLDFFDDLGVRKIFVVCAGCYRTFKEYYPRITGEKKVEVQHVVEILDELYKAGKLRIKKLEKTFIYHDPCHLGRFFGIYDEPRNLLNAAGNLIEFDKNREESFCCGADSGVRAAFKELSVQMALTKVNEALKKAEILTTACSFCLFNLNYASIKSGRKIPVKYLTEVVLEALED